MTRAVRSESSSDPAVACHGARRGRARSPNPPASSGRPLCPRVRLGREQARIEMPELPAHHVGCGCGERRDPCVRARARGSASAASPVMALVPFMTDRLSFLARARAARGPPLRAPSWLASCRLLAQDLALSGKHGGHVREWCQVTAGPDRAQHRDRGDDVPLEQRDEALEEGGAHRRIAHGERGETRRDDRSGFHPPEQRPGSAAVKAHQVLRQLQREFAAHRCFA